MRDPFDTLSDRHGARVAYHDQRREQKATRRARRRRNEGKDDE